MMLLGTVLLSACGGQGSSAEQKGGAGARGPQGGAPEVGYIVAQPTSAPIPTELNGRAAAFESSDVRPQVAGVIMRRLFREGQVVRRGQPLYQIDPSLYRAAVGQAQANLRSARANAEATSLQAERYRPLAQIRAVSQQDYTNAVAQARQGTAAVAQTQAALATAQINLRFTTVPAPISGRIGRSLFTVGALVTTSQADPLAQIQRLDPMFVDMPQPSAEVLALRQSLASGGTEPERAAVRITLPNGSLYPGTGTVEFSEALVDIQTGTVTLRARFPNPRGVLLPGMYVRARFAQAIDTRALLVPQPAIERDPKGNATLFVVGPGNNAVAHTVHADRTQGPDWVVTSGLNAGDRVIVQGTGKLRPNQPIRPVPASTPQRLDTPPAGGGATPRGGPGGANTPGASAAQGGGQQKSS